MTIPVAFLLQKKKYLIPYLRSCSSYDFGFWYTCVKWWYLQQYFSFFQNSDFPGFSKFINKCQEEILTCAPPSSHVCDFIFYFYIFIFHVLPEFVVFYFFIFYAFLFFKLKSVKINEKIIKLKENIKNSTYELAFLYNKLTSCADIIVDITGRWISSNI